MRLITLLVLLGGVQFGSLGEQVFRLSVPENSYPPYIFAPTPSAPSAGLLIDPLRAALASLDYRLEVNELPVSRAAYMLNKGELEASMSSVEWATDAQNYLWLDTGLWAEDILLFRSDLSAEPKQLNDILHSEIITHAGYGYPLLEVFFAKNTLVRLDRYTEEHMIAALQQAPKDSSRFVVMNTELWRWYQEKFAITNIRRTAFAVGCAPIQLQLVDTPAMRELLLKLQQKMQSPRTLTCAASN